MRGWAAVRILMGSASRRIALALASAALAGAAPLAASTRPPMPAFPGAQGGGAHSAGGRGGRVIEVTRLNDSGFGSLRACMEASGPRTCVFRVSGVIHLASGIHLSGANSYVTVAGQTAPGGGIALAGGSDQAAGSAGTNDSIITIAQGRGGTAHDVTIRYVRLWKGANRGATSTTPGGNAISIWDDAHDIVFDHVTAVWAQNKQVSVSAGTAGLRPRGITFQYSIFGESIYSGWNTNVIVDGLTSEVDHVTDVDFHHDYFVNQGHRTPLFKAKSGRFINNVVFNWSWYAVQIGGGGWVDVVGNHFIDGRDGHAAGKPHEIEVYEEAHEGNYGPPGAPSIYLANNVGPNQPFVGDDDWDHLIAQIDTEGAGECGQVGGARGVPWSCTDPGRLHDPRIPDGRRGNVNWKRSRPLLAATAHAGPGSPPSQSDEGVPIVPLKLAGDGRNLDRALLADDGPEPVGASRRLDCAGNWRINRDASDRRLVRYVLEGPGEARIGRTRVSDYHLGGFPNVGFLISSDDVCPPGEDDNARCVCPDSDHDGMPDAWEIAHGLNPYDASDGAARTPDGYTHLEHYLSGR